MDKIHFKYCYIKVAYVHMQPLSEEPMNHLQKYRAGRKRPGQCISEGHWSMAGYPLHSGNRQKKIPARENTGNLDYFFFKTQGIWLTQVVNTLILKVKAISIFTTKVPNFFLSWISLPSQFCVCNSNAWASDKCCWCCGLRV